MLSYNSVSGLFLPSMLLSFLALCCGGAAVLYVLYSWLIPAAVQYNAWLALLWHDAIVERALNILTRSTRPQVTSQTFHSLELMFTQLHSLVC